MLPAVLVPDCWGLPLFIISYPKSNITDVYEIQRDENSKTEASIIKSYKADSVSQYTQPHDHRIMLGCCSFGTVSDPKIGMLDSHFEMRVFTIGGDRETSENNKESDIGIEAIQKSVNKLSLVS